MPQIPYVSYYSGQGIIPVRQDTRDMGLHAARRRSLYRHLGIQALTLRGRNILEFGPGTGDNALYIASCKPSLYVLVDGNPASIQAISEKLEDGALPREIVRCQMSGILDYRDATPYDIVICEGVVPCQDHPHAFLRHVASFAGEEGIVVATTMSPASLLAEVCRRVLKPVFRKRYSDNGELLRQLVAFFEADLASLPGMSRLHEDWVLDNILHPWPEQCTFTIPEAIAALQDSFDLLGTSPVMFQDWRWYKSIPLDEKNSNDVARAEYARWSGYLMDYRSTPTTGATPPAADLDRLCQAIVTLHYRIWANDAVDELPEFLTQLNGIWEAIRESLPETAASIRDFAAGLDQLLAGSAAPDFGAFRTWFGRGQQHVSFIRR